MCKALKRRFFGVVVVEKASALDFRRARLVQAFAGDFLQNRISLFIFEQNLDAALGGVQSLLTFARKPHAVFEKLKALLERQIAVFELAHDFLQFAQR